jgi:hypothetical protein
MPGEAVEEAVAEDEVVEATREIKESRKAVRKMSSDLPASIVVAKVTNRPTAQVPRSPEEIGARTGEVTARGRPMKPLT